MTTPTHPTATDPDPAAEWQIEYEAVQDGCVQFVGTFDQAKVYAEAEGPWAIKVYEVRRRLAHPAATAASAPNLDAERLLRHALTFIDSIDDDGPVTVKAPFSWETAARVAWDMIRSALNDCGPRPTFSAPTASPAWAPTDAQLLRLWGHRSDGPDNQEIISFARAVLEGAGAQEGVPAEATTDQLIELTEALEQKRALHIAEIVKSLAPDDDMPKPYWSGWFHACEEIAHRLEHEKWELSVEGGWAPVGGHPASNAPIFATHPTPAQEASGGSWREHVEERLRGWRQRLMNKSGDRLALDDFMGQESIDDLIDYVCDAYDAPQAPAQAAPQPVAWMFQHDETGRMSFCPNDGVNTVASFVASNPRLVYVAALYPGAPEQAAPQAETPADAPVLMKLIRAAWKGDRAIAEAYGNLLADRMDEDGRSGKYVRQMLEGLRGERVEQVIHTVSAPQAPAGVAAGRSPE